MSEHLWYYNLLNETFGPVSTEKIQELVAAGQLSSTDQIRPETSDDWISVADLKTLVDSVASGEDEWEEVTDLDDLNFTFEDSSAGVAQASRDTATSPLEDLDERNASLDIDSFNLTGNIHEPTKPVAADVEQQSDFWMVETRGQVLGPKTMSELNEMARTGAVCESARLRLQSSTNWVTADSVESIRTALTQRASDIANGSPESSTQAEVTETEAGGPSKSTPGKKRRRKKKRSKKDELLAEIFSDVFSDDGSVRDLSERPDLAKPSSPAVVSNQNPSGSSAGMAPGAGVSSGTNSGKVPGGSVSTPGMGAASGVGASPGMGATARPAFTPSKRKKKRGGGVGLAMPEPTVLAAIAGVLLVALLATGHFAGWFELPGLSVDAKEMIKSFEAKFPATLTKTQTKEEWEDFKYEFASDAESVIADYSEASPDDAEATLILKKANMIVRLLGIPSKAKVSRNATWEEYQELK